MNDSELIYFKLSSLPFFITIFSCLIQHLKKETLKNHFPAVRSLSVETFQASHTLRQLLELLHFLKTHDPSTCINCEALVIVRRITKTHNVVIMSSLLWFTFTFMVLCAVHCYPSEQISSGISAEQEEDPVNDNSLKEEENDISTLLEKANKYVGQELDEPTVIGDIAIPTDLGNADPCTSRGCKWKKSSNGLVSVPYVISNQYSSRERAIIERGLQSFAASTCIRFKRRTRERDFVDIQSRGGCYSFVGRRGRGQVVSLSRQGCVFHQIVQHELLHALGFNHEQTRSDRDQHVRILYQNIIRGQEHNFRKINTNNLGTPYDYSSVMHYGRYAFSRNRQPTIVPIPNSNVAIGRATQMSRFDILRINRLYGCKKRGRSG